MLDRLVDLILWILVSYGITNGVVGSSMLSSFRRKTAKFNEYLGDLISCPMCFGFWVGGFLGVIWLSPTSNLFLDCFLSSATCWLIHTWEESKII